MAAADETRSGLSGVAGGARPQERCDGNVRRLPDGSEFTIVKIAYAPLQLEALLTNLGWTAKVTPLSPAVYVVEAHR